jgi:ABC-2 type transport system permease protein
VSDVTTFSFVRLAALMRKETLQILRDPSTLLIAVVLPIIILFLFAYAVSLDIRQVPIGVVLESNDASAQSLAAAFSGTRYFLVTPARDRREVVPKLIAGTLRGFVVIPPDFDQRLAAPRLRGGLIQVITDGSQPNTANFVAVYAQNVLAGWLVSDQTQATSAPVWVPRFWFNQDIDSRHFLVPGALAVVMTIIGTLLTALVVAREWERGTMEALMSTSVSVMEILLGKLLPYFVLGLLAMTIATLLSITVFEVPLRGSWWALLLTTSLFLIPALGQGLLISVLSKNQFIASQFALITGYLPAFMLSGFLFEIDSMPWPVRMFTHLVPARYFVSSLQTLFLVGDVWPLLLPNMLGMLGLGAVFFFIARRKLHKSLEA